MWGDSYGNPACPEAGRQLAQIRTSPRAGPESARLGGCPGGRLLSSPVPIQRGRPPCPTAGSQGALPASLCPSPALTVHLVEGLAEAEPSASLLQRIVC